ncbi:hypothetical protein CN918_26935 [Priestia megaterium]|nr:hypothetical protein CN918_26935 [Priestia megaterium]
MINRMILVGRLGDNPKMTTTKNGNKVATFPLPLYHQGAKEGAKTQWVECQVWNRLAEIVFESQKTGNLVYVEGELNYNSWQNENGEWRNSTSISVNLIRFLTPKSSSSTPTASTESEQTQTYEEYQEENPIEALEKDLAGIL